MAKPDALDEVLAHLDTLEPMQRARWLGAMLDRRNAPRLRAERVALIYEATRQWSYDTVAAELGVSWSAVRNAVTAHAATLRAAEPGATESIESDTAQAAQREEQQ